MNKSYYGTKEVSEALQVPRSTIARWRDNGTLPDPVDEIAASPIWERRAIEKFKRQREEAERREEARREALEAEAAA